MLTAGLTDAATLRLISVLSDSDPRTVRRVLEGRPTRPATWSRIVQVLAEQGLADPASLRRNEPSGASPSMPSEAGDP